MTTFDLSEVRGFAAALDARLTRCDNGEGTECATLDASLRHYAEVCCSYLDEVRAWGRAVFSGRVEFDSEVERVLRDEGARIQSRALELWARGLRVEGTCYILEGQRCLQAALWELDRLLRTWVTPARAIGPLARQGLTMDDAAVNMARQRIAALPPFDAEWRQDDSRRPDLDRTTHTP